MGIPLAISVQQLDARGDIIRMLLFRWEGMGEAREAVLDYQEVPIAVEPLHPIPLGGHEVA
eukprot:1159966-Alexandrium_andersonii.AAC.1